jgi:hypothetical protein
MSPKTAGGQPYKNAISLMVIKIRPFVMCRIVVSVVGVAESSRTTVLTTDVVYRCVVSPQDCELESLDANPSKD